MSNALAIAAVTAVLRDLLQDGLIDHDVTGTLGDVTVSVLTPNRAQETLAPDASLLNLFLYQATPNPGWRNIGLPARDQRGDLVSDPPLALDLHYLLTVYTNQDYLAELLLGYAMQLLHETPVLSRDAIRAALAPPSPVSGAPLPGAARASLVAADLADQVELIKITPEPLTMEQMSHIWASLQANYRPTAAYQASVVLIESRRPTRQSLPVRRRNIYTLPFRQPSIEQIGSQRLPADPISLRQPILPGYRLVILGRQLRGDDVALRIGTLEIAIPQAQAGDTQINVSLPAGLRAGVQAVQVIHRLLLGTPPTPHRGVESNVAAFILHPTITAMAGARDGDGNVDVTLTFTPPVGKKQRITLLLNELPGGPPPVDRVPFAYTFALPARADAPPPNDSDTTLTVTTSGVAPGTYLARVQVDGAESPLEPLPVEPFPTGPYTGPLVVIP